MFEFECEEKKKKINVSSVGDNMLIVFCALDHFADCFHVFRYFFLFLFAFSKRAREKK